jgi:hypothetical protein
MVGFLKTQHLACTGYRADAAMGSGQTKPTRGVFKPTAGSIMVHGGMHEGAQRDARTHHAARNHPYSKEQAAETAQTRRAQQQEMTRLITEHINAAQLQSSALSAAVAMPAYVALCDA